LCRHRINLKRDFVVEHGAGANLLRHAALIDLADDLEVGLLTKPIRGSRCSNDETLSSTTGQTSLSRLAICLQVEISVATALNPVLLEVWKI
jgi:hypothetical protein